MVQQPNDVCRAAQKAAAGNEESEPEDMIEAKYSEDEEGQEDERNRG